MAKELTNAQKKEWAEMLFVRGELLQKEIAAKVGVSERTMTSWSKDGNWESLRKSMLTTKTEILRTLYDLLDKIGKKLKDEDSIGDSKIADMYVKYTAAINNLETETSIAEISDVGIKFTSWLQNVDPQFALQVLNHLDMFVKEKIKHGSTLR